MRIPKYIIPLIQDRDMEVRTLGIQIFLYISKALLPQTPTFSPAQLRQFRGLSEKKLKTNTPNLQKKDFHSDKKSLPEIHKDYTLMNYINNSQVDKQNAQRYVELAFDLPNLHFKANLCFLSEMGKCFENPVFIAPFIRQLKNPGESLQNR